MITLRPDQLRMLNDAREMIRSGIKRLILQGPTGVGKTCLATEIIGGARKRGKRSWFNVHRVELLDQSSEAFRENEIPHAIISAGYAPDPRQLAQVCGIPSLARRLDRVAAPDLIVWDECFPAGTMIDGRPIEILRVGDYARSFNHADGSVEHCAITSLFQSIPAQLCVVTIAGQRIACTPGHPFFVEGKGYVEAKRLVAGDAVYRLSHVPHAGRPHGQEEAESVAAGRPDVLQPGMREQVSIAVVIGNDGQDESQVRLGAHDRAQSDAARLSARTDKRIPSGEGPQATGAGRQWQGDDGSAASAHGGHQSAGHGAGIGSEDGRSKVGASDALQDRLGDTIDQAGDRGGRGIARRVGPAGAGPEKGGVLVLARVDGVALQEPTSDRTFGGLLPDGYVYNIEVEHNHNYFADGILVHNCHHIAAASWAAIADRYPNAIQIGLTATPVRTDGTGLDAHFDAMVIGPSVRTLIDEGKLSPYRYLEPQLFDASALHSRGGEYRIEEMEELVNNPRITGSAISHYASHCNGARAVVFCASVKHSLDVCEQFKQAGIPAAHIDGTTDRDLRRALIGAFRVGEIRILTNVGIFAEGFNLPAMEACIMLRPTQSLGMFLQQAGRCLRYEPGKTAVILDHAGNSSRHQYPCTERTWTLQGRRKRAKGAVESPIRQCPQCYASLPASHTRCPCGYTFEPTPREVEQVDGELAEVDVLAQRRERLAVQGSARSLEQLTEVGIQRYGAIKGPRWAGHVHQARLKKDRERAEELERRYQRETGT